MQDTIVSLVIIAATLLILTAAAKAAGVNL